MENPDQEQKQTSNQSEQNNEELSSPKTGILDQARLRPLGAVQRPSNVEGKIVNTLIKLQSLGREKGTLEHVSYRLSVLAKHCNLDNPDEVSEFIANQKWADSQIRAHAEQLAYMHSVKKLKWEFNN